MGVYFGYYVTLNSILRTPNTSTDVRNLKFSWHDCIFLDNSSCIKKERAQKWREEANNSVTFKTELRSRCAVCFSLQVRLSSPHCVFREAAKQIDLAQRWCSSQKLFQASCGATEYLKDSGFHGENTKKNETCHALKQWFSTMGYFAPQRTSDNIWDHSWLSELGERMFLEARGEMQINMLQCRGWPSQERVTWLKCQESQVAQWQRIHLSMQETQVRPLSWEDPLQKEMATHSSILTWEIPWSEEAGRPQSMGLHKSRTQISN